MQNFNLPPSEHVIHEFLYYLAPFFFSPPPSPSHNILSSYSLSLNRNLLGLLTQIVCPLFSKFVHVEAAYRSMARITLADWTCDINRCIYPLDGIGLNKNFSRYKGKIPTSWIVAQKTMWSLAPTLSLRTTDQMHIATGDVSLSHALKICDHITPMDSIDNPNSITIRSLRAGNVRTVKDVGNWIIDKNGAITFKAKAWSFIGWSTARKNNWTKITEHLSQVKPQSSLFLGLLPAVSTLRSSLVQHRCSFEISGRAFWGGQEALCRCQSS
jgi:hypothetical protein